MQHAVPDLETLAIDMTALTAKRDRMVHALEASGYELVHPEGTFYLFCRCPLHDEQAFWEALADHDVFVLPGRLMETPGYFRVSLTASMQMIERALPAFAEVASSDR